MSQNLNLNYLEVMNIFFNKLAMPLVEDNLANVIAELVAEVCSGMHNLLKKT